MWWKRDRAYNIYSKMNYDFDNNYLYLYPAIRPILLSGIICIVLSGKFYCLELSVSGYSANFTIRASISLCIFIFITISIPTTYTGQYFLRPQLHRILPKACDINLDIMQKDTWAYFSLLTSDKKHLLEKRVKVHFISGMLGGNL